MASRRETSGEIIERVRGREYSIRVRLPPDEDHPKWHWSHRRKVKGNKAEATAALVAYQEELEGGLDASAAETTVAKYAREFQNDRIARCKLEKERAESAGEAPRYTLSPNTIKRDEVETQRIEEYFAHVALKDLSPADINRAYRKLQQQGVSASALHKLHRKLSQVMKHAVREGIIASNPCNRADEVQRPKPKERRSLSLEQAAQLASDLKASDRNGCIVAVWLALATGGRRGEILGLTWDDVDLEGKRLYFRRQLDRNKELRDPKSETSKRNLAINDGDVAFLTEWKRMVSERFYGGDAVPGSSPVCTNEIGSWLEPNFFNKWRRNFFAEHGLGRFEKVETYTDGKGQTRTRKSGYVGYNLHELRHTQATLLIGSGADIKTVQNRLGHSSASLTMNIYAHAIERNDREAAEAIGGMLGM